MCHCKTPKPVHVNEHCRSKPRYPSQEITVLRLAFKGTENALVHFVDLISSISGVDGIALPGNILPHEY
jgi:hypothetical protein